MQNKTTKDSNFLQISSEQNLGLENNVSQNTTIVMLDDSYFEEANVYVQTNFDQWKDKKKPKQDLDITLSVSLSKVNLDFRIFIPSGIEGLSMNSTPIAIYHSDYRTGDFDNAFKSKKEFTIQKITNLKKLPVEIYELQLNKNDQRFLGFQTKSTTAISILAISFKLTPDQIKKLEAEIMNLSKTKLIKDCVPYVFLDICEKHEDISKTAKSVSKTYRELISNSEQPQNKSKSR